MKKILISLLLLLSIHSFASVWQVGPSRTYTFCSQIASLVQAGDTIEIDYATYVNDPQVQWNQNDLLIKGVGGRPTLQAGSTIANDLVNGKGIFVIGGQNVRVENIEFTHAAVVDHNGAGIRQEGRNLHISNCKFDGNEMGILCGNIANCKTLIEYSEFVNGGSTANPGYQHNIYINHIDTFIFRYNYSHNAIAEGHELKSRATNNIILYNRIANESSIDSRTIDLPNGGITLLMGNIIEQGVNSANSNLVGYGLEGLTNTAPHCLYAVNNTFINKKTTGSFINVQNGTDTLFVKNNLMAGAKTGGMIIGTPNILDSAGNQINDNIMAFGFIDAVQYDYHLQSGSSAKDAGISINKTVVNYALTPVSMYKDTCSVEPRPAAGMMDVGAFEIPFATTIDEMSPTSPLTLFPNPSQNDLHMMGYQTGQYTIYSVEGKMLQQGKVIDHTIDIHQLIPGHYMLEIGKKKTSFIKK